MSKKRPPPLTAVRGDFIDSLETTLVTAGLLAVQVKTLLDLKQVNPSARVALAARLAAFEHAYYGERQ